MNKLNGQWTYLCGNMDAIPGAGKKWREDITPLLENLGIKVLNPHSKPFFCHQETPETRTEIHKLKESEKTSLIRERYGKIRTVDLRMVDKADFIIARLDLNHDPCGSWEEIFTANSQKKPVLLYCEGGFIRTPAWMFFTLPYEIIFNQWNDLLKYIEDINNGIKTDDLGRWYFYK